MKQRGRLIRGVGKAEMVPARVQEALEQLGGPEPIGLRLRLGVPLIGREPVQARGCCGSIRSAMSSAPRADNRSAAAL